ncbi:MAG: molybdopterin-binding protein [Sphingomonadales bacterium]
MAAAASGATEVSVTRQPRVAILVTGDEVHSVGAPPSNSLAIPDSISLAVSALAARWGADVITPSSAPDNARKIAAAFREATYYADVVIMTGGASVGDHDHCKAAVREAGGQFQFAKVAMKPGKPVWHAMIGKTHVLGLPGNPTAALTTARLFLAPLLCALSGRLPKDALLWHRAGWSEGTPPSDTRERFCAVRGTGKR